jgi:hypothetical protein
MKKITKIKISFEGKERPVIMESKIWEVVSEPGDGSRYHYLVVKQGDTFMFLPLRNTFKYPQKIGYWGVVDIDVDMDNSKLEMSKKITEIARFWDSNPWTVRECIATMKELK